jgi:Spy/CpxP family protein refolding chaperone
MTLRSLLAATFLVATAGTATAQVNPASPGNPASAANPEPDFARHVFAPELVMKYQQRIGLRPEQRAAITEAIQRAQSTMVEHQWRMLDEAQKLGDLLQAPTVNESAVLSQVDRVLGIEREVKRAQMGLLVRIKNALTREQQAALRSLRDAP